MSNKKAIELANIQKQTVQNRLQYLSREQENYQKKISSARREVEKRA